MSRSPSWQGRTYRRVRIDLTCPAVQLHLDNFRIFVSSHLPDLSAYQNELTVAIHVCNSRRRPKACRRRSQNPVIRSNNL